MYEKAWEGRENIWMQESACNPPMVGYLSFLHPTFFP
jgi:hypothetical protein